VTAGTALARRGLLALLATLALAACTSKGPTPPAPETTVPSPTTDVESMLGRAIGSTEVRQGETYWAVYLDTGRPGSGDVRRAEKTVEDLGIASVASPVDCDEGAPEVLNLGTRDIGVAVYFKQEEDARAFGLFLEKDPAAVTMVRTFCAD